MANGGTANLLHALLTTDLAGFDAARDLPRTEALATQRALSLDPVEEWWYEQLQLGELPVRDMNSRGDEVVGRAAWNAATQVEVKVMQEDFRRWRRDARGRGEQGTATKIGQLLARVLPGGKPEVTGRSPHKAYLVPSLDEARQSWAEAQGGKWTW
jgi:hypothetical protein